MFYCGLKDYKMNHVQGVNLPKCYVTKLKNKANLFILIHFLNLSYSISLSF